MYNERDLAMEKISMEMGIPKEALPFPSLSSKMGCIQHRSEIRTKIYPIIIRTDQGLGVAKSPSVMQSK